MTITCIGLFISMFTVNIQDLPVDIVGVNGDVKYHYHVATNYYSEVSNWAVLKSKGKTLTVGLKCE